MITSKKRENVENPFYKMSGTLTLMQQASKMLEPNKGTLTTLLNGSWIECKDNAEKRALFFCIVFSLGDIQNREHNIFSKKGIKPDQGGNSLRKTFLYCLEWMHKNVYEQFYNFLPVYGEYYNLGANTMYHILWTDRFKGTVKEVFKVVVDVDRLTDYIASVLKNPKTTENEKKLWAKWLWHIPTGRRRRKIIVTDDNLAYMRKKHDVNVKTGDVIRRTSEKQKDTVEKDTYAKKCIKVLSEKMGWEIEQKDGYTNFSGYRAFRSPYLEDNESTMFSSQRICELTEIELLDWFDQLPSGARYNVQRRLCEKSGDNLVTRGKWISKKGEDIGKTYLTWVQAKEDAQDKLRNLSEDDKSSMDEKELKTLTKQAKVNTGANTLMDVLVPFLSQQGDAKTLNVLAQSILDKIKIEVPVFCIVDTSASMGMNSFSRAEYKGTPIKAIDMAALAATTFLLKNPREELTDVMMKFSSTTKVITGGITTDVKGKNRFLPGKEVEVTKLIDPKQDFLANYRSISNLLKPSGATRFSVVADHLYDWAKSDGEEFFQIRKEQILEYPVFLVISDGDMNGDGNATETMRSFQHKMLQWFGWSGVVVVWDVKKESEEKSKFDNLENVVYYGSCNPGTVSQIFTNIDDLDIIDVYTPLLSLYRSNRYNFVKELVI